MREGSWNSYAGDLIPTGTWNTFKAKWTEQPTNFPWPFQKPACPVFRGRRIYSTCCGTTIIHSRVGWVLAPPQRLQHLESEPPKEKKSTDSSPPSGEQRITAIISKRLWNAEMTYCFVWNWKRQSASFNKPAGGVNFFKEWRMAAIYPVKGHYLVLLCRRKCEEPLV